MKGVWPVNKEPELRALRESGVSINEIAEIAGVSKQVASYHLLDIEPVTKLIDMLPVYTEEMLWIPDEPCALTADWHAPYLSMKWVRRLLAVCAKMGVKSCAIDGDFADLSWIARYVRKEHRGSLAHDLTIIFEVLKMLLDFFDDVYWCYGNHEDRFAAALQGHDVIEPVSKLIAKAHKGKLHVTDQRFMLLGDSWRLEHPKVYSRDAAKVAAAAAAILHKNIACGHGHHLGFKYDVSGKFMGVDLGGMFDEDRQEYLFKTGMTTLPAWNPGFWIYHNGRVTPFDNMLTDWREWGTE